MTRNTATPQVTRSGHVEYIPAPCLGFPALILSLSSSIESKSECAESSCGDSALIAKIAGETKMSEANPWVSRPAVEPQPLAAPATVSALSEPSRPIAPQSRVPVPEAQLPFVYPLVWAPLWVIGAHGGAGETSLASMLPGAIPTQHGWPQVNGQVLPVVVVARSNATGLNAAQRAAQQWAAGLVPGVELLGLVVMQDAPGRWPKVLRDRQRVIAGGFPRSWSVPWIESWRLSDSVTPAAVPREARRVVDELIALITPKKG